MYVREPIGDRVLYVDPQIERITGYTQAQWLGGGMLERALHPEDRERVLDEIAGAQKSDEHLSLVYRMQRPDGGTVWVRDASELVEYEGSQRRRGFLYDITAQRESEITRERQTRLALGLIDAALDGMCLTGRDGSILLVNARLRRLWGGLQLPTEGTMGERLRVLGEHASRRSDREAVERIISSPHERISHEFELAGLGRSFMGFVAPIETADSEYLGRVWTLHETTEERTLERLRYSFTASVSHELRTPLTSILGYLDLLREGLDDLDPKQARYLEVITRNANRLLDLVNDLLFVAQIQAGSFEIEHVALDPIELVGAAVESARPAAEGKQIDLSFDAGDARPISGDPVRLGQALDNLISNAVKFTIERGRVHVHAEVADDRCNITVVDNGIGIPRSEQSRLFERFFRSSNATDNAIPGTGLGLAIVKAIIEAHGGTVALQSDANAGTTVRISLPCENPSQAPAREPPALPV
jgi:PAS domain S-box-containing protein